MVLRDYIPKKQDTYIEWHAAFTEELACHSAAFDISANELAQLNSYNRIFGELLLAVGTPDGDDATAVTDLHLMIFRSQGFVRFLVQRIKDHRSYTEAVGRRLGIEAREVVADLSRHQSDGIYTFGDTARRA